MASIAVQFVQAFVRMQCNNVVGLEHGLPSAGTVSFRVDAALMRRRSAVDRFVWHRVPPKAGLGRGVLLVWHAWRNACSGHSRYQMDWQRPHAMIASKSQKEFRASSPRTRALPRPQHDDLHVMSAAHRPAEMQSKPSQCLSEPGCKW